MTVFRCIMGSSCSSTVEKGRPLTHEDRVKKRSRKRRISMTSSSGVNLQVEAKPDPISEEAVMTDPPHDILSKLDPEPATIDPEVEHKAPSVTSTIPAPTRPIRTSQVSMEVKHITIDEYPKQVQNMLLGNVQQFRDERPRVIYLYIAACEQDSRVERLSIMRHVIQPLSDLCYKRGFAFELIDPHWLGHKEYSIAKYESDDSLLRDKLDAPTLMLILLNDKLGFCLPWALPEDVFQTIISRADDSMKEVLDKYYLPDDTKQSSVFRLSFLQCCKSEAIRKTFCLNCQKELIKVDQFFKKTMTTNEKRLYLKSGLEREITHGLDERRIPSENVFVVKRTFKDISGVSELYMDLEEGERDQHSIERLDQLGNTITNSVPATNSFSVNLKWTPEALDPVTVPAHARYENELCDVLLSNLTEKVKNIIVENSPTVLPHDIPDALYQEVSAHVTLCQKLKDVYHAPMTFVEKVTSYVCSTEQHPLVLRAEVGMDTHAITANLSTLTFPENMAKIIRFFGLTPESKSMAGMFSGLQTQVQHVYSKPLMDITPSAFHDILGSATENRPLLLVLGEITQSPGEWLPVELPAHVKLVLLTNDQHVFDDLRKQVPIECFMKIPSLSKEARSKSVETIRGQFEENELSLTSDHGVSAVTSLRRELFCDSSISPVLCTDENPTVKIFDDFMEKLESSVSQCVLTNILSLLLLTKSGLCSFHIATLLSQDEQVTNQLQTTDPVLLFHAILLLWSTIRTVLRPFLHCFAYNGIFHYVIYNATFKGLLQHRYLPNNAKDIHQRICAFCDTLNCDNGGQNNNHPYYFQSLQTFKYLEYPFHHKVCKKSRFNEEFVFNLSWLRNKLQATSTVILVEDYADTDDEEVRYFSQILSSSSSALDISPSQLLSQVKARVRDYFRYSNIARLLDESEQKGDSLFESKSSCFNFPGSIPRQHHSEDVVCTLYVPPNQNNYAIALLPSKGEIIVVDIKTQERLRTFQGINQPHDLKMVDSYRAVVLCNRELKIFNLNEGCLETSLRGVLNLRKPMYDVMSEESIITVSRNRMYINVLDIASGDTVATFKAGEDRFLNSLLVSKNGKILVCGDETQKPSPLLVWELEESRLLHDLRMPQHEFITSICDITEDGHYVVCACQELESVSPNFLVVYDLLSGQVFKIWKWEHDVTCVSIHNRSRCVISGLDTGDVIVWDLVSGNARFNIKGVNSVFNRLVLSSNSDRCVTWYKGETILPHSRTICVWDTNNGVLVGCLTFDSRPSCCTISSNGDAVILGLPGHEEIVTFTLNVQNIVQSEDFSYGDPEKKGAVFQL